MTGESQTPRRWIHVATICGVALTVLLLLLPQFVVEYPPIFLAADLSNDGSQVILGSHQGQLLVWDVEEGKTEVISSENLGWIQYINVSPDSDTIAVGGMLGDSFRLSIVSREKATWSTLWSSLDSESHSVKWPGDFLATRGFYLEQTASTAREWISLGGEEPGSTSRCFVDPDLNAAVLVAQDGIRHRLPGSIETQIYGFDWNLDDEKILARTPEGIIIWSSLTADPFFVAISDTEAVYLFGTDHFVCKRRDTITLHDFETGVQLDEWELDGTRLIVNGDCERVVDIDFHNATLIGRDNDHLVEVKMIHPEETPLQPWTTWRQIRDALFR